MDPFPSSPSSAWSCTHSRSSSSANQDNLPPHTPDSYFFPAPAIVSPDEFAFQIDVQLDRMVGSPHLLPHPSLPFPKTVPCFPSGDDVSKAQVLMRNTGRWGNLHDPLEGSDTPRALSLSGASDDFYLKTNHSAPADPDNFLDPSRCSLLIHEVSLLVGLTAEDDYLSYDDRTLPSDAPKQVHDILPLGLTPTKSLACRKRRNAGLPRTDTSLHPSGISIPPSIDPLVDNVDPSWYNSGYPPVGSRDPATPTPRYRRADAPLPSLSPRRRHGQVFLEPSIGNVHHQIALDLDDMFTHPRRPPPKPTPTPSPTANRCSSLDRLECSLLKLEAHAPRNHRKSRSEGRPHVAQRKDRRPSLPPPPRLKRQSSREVTHRITSRPDPPPLPVSRPMPPPSRQYVAPPIFTVVPLDEDPFEEDLTPSSFMDMDLPLTEVAQPEQRSSLRHVKSREKVKSLVSVAKRVSRGMISWGKSLTGSTKPPAKEAPTLRRAHV